ncbi:hypothetical protein Tco_0361420 [Tanacetum coccineum]
MATLEFCDKHNMVAYLEKPEGSAEFHQIIDFLTASHIHYALTENPTIYASFIKQFWTTATASTNVNGEVELTASIDGQAKTITEASLRRHLKLEDNGGITSLPNTEIFEQLALMGYATDSDKLTFQKWKFLIHTILHCLSPKKTAWEQFSSNIATAIICLATNRTFNFSNLIFEAMVKNLDSKTKFLMYPRFIQIFLNKHQRLLLPHKRTYPTPTLTQKLFSNMKRASKGYSGVNTPLFQTMLVQDQGEGPTIPVVSHHTPTSGPSTSQPPSTPPSIQTTPVAEEAAPMPYDSPLPRVHSLRSDEGSLSLNELMVLCTSLSKKVESLESELKQTKQTYSTALTKLIKRVKKLEQTIKTSQARRRAKVVISDAEEDEEDSSKQGRSLIEEMDLDAGISLVPPHVADQGRFDDTQVSDQPEEQLGVFSAAKVLADAAEQRRDVENVQTYTRRRRSVSTGSGGVSTTSELVSTAGVKAKDKGKAVMQEVAANKDFVQQLQTGEKVSDEDLPRKLVDLVNQRKKFFSQQRAKAKRNKPMTPTQQKEYMITYIKNQEGVYTLKQLKALSFKKVKEIFEATMRKVQSFVPMDSELEVQRLKRAGQDVVEEPAKKQRTGEALGSVQEQTCKEPKAEELSQEQLHQMMMVIPVEEVYVKALQVKYPVINWEIYSEDSRKYWKIIRVGGHTEAYQTFDDITTKPIEDKARELWVELKRLFKPNDNDTLWKLQRYMHDLLNWWLYDTCGVYYVSTERGHDIYMLVEKDYPLTKALATLMLCNKLRVDQYSDMADELL